MSPFYAKLTPTEVYKAQMKRRSIGHIRTAILATSAWGILETTLLRLIGKLDTWLKFPVHRYFMRFMHGRFGGVVTPFENALEPNQHKRTWETREPWQTVSHIQNNEVKGKILQKGEVMILPTQEILNIALRADLRTSVSYCFCRLYAREKGHQCEINAPIRTCLTLFLPESVDSIANREPDAKLLAKQEQLYKLLKRCDDIGLVHQVVFIPSPNYTYVICNCCPDCCECLGGFREAKKLRDYHRHQIDLLDAKIQTAKESSKEIQKLHRKRVYHEKGAGIPLSPLEIRSVFIATTSESSNCINCGKCASRCYFDSRYMSHGQLHFNPANCYGCGLCVTTCPQQIIRLDKRLKPRLMGEGPNAITHVHPHQGHSNQNHQH